MSKATATAALIWAVVIGVPMAGGAMLIGLSWSDALEVGVLGGLGAAVFVLLYAAQSSRRDRSSD
jgi:cytosine/uracil/thiamine/allantoin permease